MYFDNVIHFFLDKKRMKKSSCFSLTFNDINKLKQLPNPVFVMLNLFYFVHFASSGQHLIKIKDLFFNVIHFFLDKKTNQKNQGSIK